MLSDVKCERYLCVHEVRSLPELLPDRAVSGSEKLATGSCAGSHVTSPGHVTAYQSKTRNWSISNSQKIFLVVTCQVLHCTGAGER